MVLKKEFSWGDSHHNPNLAGRLAVIAVAVFLRMALCEAAKW